MQLDTTGLPLDIGVNVNVKVVNRYGKIKNEINKHNKATINMTEGVCRFLRGEFNETFLTLSTIGTRADQAKYYIPSYIGIGCAGYNSQMSGVIYDDTMNVQYTDISLRREIFPADLSEELEITKNNCCIPIIENNKCYIKIDRDFKNGIITSVTNLSATVNGNPYSNIEFEFDSQNNILEVIGPDKFIVDLKGTQYFQSSEVTYKYKKQQSHRMKIARSTSNSSSLIDTNSITISAYYQFRHNFKFFESNGTKLNPIHGINIGDSEHNGEYIITELGLFSGDIDDSNSKLLARLLLDSETPIYLDKNSTLIINWTLGVYSLDDQLFRQKSSNEYYDYDYVKRETNVSGVQWQNID